MTTHFPDNLFICPVCGTPLTGPQCHGCNNEYFMLGDIPCLFPAGLQQKALWQHQMAMMGQQGQAALAALDETLQGYDLTEKTRERLEITFAATDESLQSIFALLEEGGLQAQFDATFEHTKIDNPAEYYQHILRDWAWDNAPSRHYDSHANAANLERVQKVWGEHTAGKILVLGAGAGRLSWDLHQHFNAPLTLASDINPFLLAFAHKLIKTRQAISLPELCTYPQIGYDYAKRWIMEPPEDNNNSSERWFALGADVWNMPLPANSMDTIVTSWLLDVTGGDIKDLIAVVAYLLKPGGRWINTGPLLYPHSLPVEQKYSAEELLEFADMAGFELDNQTVEEIAHMASPLNARYHHEQLLTFSATKRSSEAKALPTPSKTSEWLTPPWLVMHHLPVPNMQYNCTMEHDFIRKALALVDGERSIHLISQMMQQDVPEGVDAKHTVVAMFGQILEGMTA